MNSGPTLSKHSRIWLAAIIVTTLAIAVAFLFPSRPRQDVHAPPSERAHAPLNERSRGDLILKDSRLFEPDGLTPFSGLVLDTYDGGEKKSRSTVSNGLLEGLSEGWHTNGQRQVEEHFVAGVSHGLRTKWYPNGQKLSEVTVVSGKLSGTFRSWHENGARAEEVELKDGQPDGFARAYFPSGFLKSQVTLRNGKVVDQKFWSDGEFKEAASATPADTRSVNGS